MSKVEEKIKKYSNAVSANVTAAIFGIPIDSKVTQAIKRQHQAFINDLEEIQAEQEELQRKIQFLERSSDFNDETIGKLRGTLKKLTNKLKEQSKTVEVPDVAKFIADWYKLHENDLEFGIWKYIYDYSDQDKETKFYRWFNNTDNKPIETLIRMKNGYTVQQEREKIYLKIEPEYLEAVRAGIKTFEIRKNDRDYQVDDILILQEYTCGSFTDNCLEVKITYITDYAQKDNYVVLGIVPANE